MAILRGISRRHKRLVAIIFFVLAIPSLAVVYLTSRPLYVSLATIAIESSPLDQSPLFKDLARKDTIVTYLVLLNSRSFTETVVEALPKESFEELLTDSQYTDYILTLSNWIKRWLGRSPTVLSPQQRAVAELQNARMEFTQVPQAPGVLNIKGSASKPRVAMDLVNTHIQVLLSRTRSSNQEEARKAREFLEQQVQQIKESLTQAEEALTKFQQQKGRLGLGSQTDFDLIRLSQIENALAEAQASREVLTARIANMRQSLDPPTIKDPRGATDLQGKEKSGTATAAASSAENVARYNAFTAAQGPLAKLEVKLVTMRERYT